MPEKNNSSSDVKKASKKLLEKVLKEKNLTLLIKQGFSRKEAEMIMEKEDLMKKEEEKKEKEDEKTEEEGPFKGITIKIDFNHE